MESKPKSKVNKSNTNCCVSNCHSRRGKNMGISFHRFPKNGERKIKLTNKNGEIELVDKRTAWIAQIRTDKVVTEHMSICSLHFKKEDLFFPDVPCQKRKLKFTAVPTCNLPIEQEVTKRKRPKKRIVKPEKIMHDTTENFRAVKHCTRYVPNILRNSLNKKHFC